MCLSNIPSSEICLPTRPKSSYADNFVKLWRLMKDSNLFEHKPKPTSAITHPLHNLQPCVSSPVPLSTKVWMGYEKAISVKEYPHIHPSIHPSIHPVSMCFQPLYFLQMYKISFYCQLNTKCVIKKKNSVLIVLHWLNVTTKLFLIFSGYFLHIYFAVVSK